MSSRIVVIDHPDLAGMMMTERLARIVIDHVKSGEFAGRIDMPLAEFDILEREMISRNHPAFKLAGNAREGTWHIAWVVAGAPVDVYPDRGLELRKWRVEVRE